MGNDLRLKKVEILEDSVQKIPQVFHLKKEEQKKRKEKEKA
eukprot:CAMPEP_0201498848 /NCGR_PEP_ID=MMETSP0151_2-20130828/73296_1 /ASSEMBLY_ACC=CAM_ASM_000257 /TAXON_ID=200890 /ORGANISM="Paramoeba atlantica, Strain 621/1 / CCAP 1560/9" /LENGTH=40 /DNA_ID= /DNA_START= /DNA_END= /DNA_ORIENTATION=